MKIKMLVLVFLDPVSAITGMKNVVLNEKKAV